MLAITGLKHAYGQTAVLDLPDWQLAEGEQLLLLGPSGSGKTTLLHIVAGLLPANEGRIMVAGQALADMAEAARDQFRGKRIGLVFQNFHLIAALSVMDNLLLAQHLAGMIEDRGYCLRLLAELGVERYADRFPRSLSQGQAQRVAIARALANRPQLILADEPTSALDDGNCRAVIELLVGQAREKNASLIVASHDARIRDYFAQVMELRML